MHFVLFIRLWCQMMYTLKPFALFSSKQIYQIL